MFDDKISNCLIATTTISKQQTKVLEKWIENHKFKDYESPAWGLSKITSPRNNNKIYQFMLDDINCQVVMKVLYINKDYKWTRKLELILKYYLREDANRSAFHCCQKACRYSLAKPLAYWQTRESLTQVKSYLLYQYIEASFPWYKLYVELEKIGDKAAEQKRDLIRRKIIDALKLLHQQGIRHGDVATHNILMSVQNPENLSDAKVYFIDYDRSTRTKIKYPAFIRKFFDIRDFYNMQIPNTSPYDMLNIYLDGDYPLWRAVLTFWRWGGFNFFQWRNPDTCPARKHLK